MLDTLASITYHEGEDGAHRKVGRRCALQDAYCRREPHNLRMTENIVYS